MPFKLDVRSDYPSYTSLQVTAFTIHYWMKRATTSDYETIFSFEDYDSALYGYQTGIWEGTVFLSVSDGAIHGPQFRGSISVVDDKWHWIAITNDTVSDYIKIYVDGKLDLSDWRDSLGYNGYELACVGAWWYNNGGVAYDFYSGYLDNLHVLNVALPETTIRRIYASMRGWL